MAANKSAQMRVCRGGLILCGSLLGLTLVARSATGCACAGPTGAKTMREVAAWYSDGPNANNIIFEGAVEKQEALVGPVGTSRETTSRCFSRRSNGADQRFLL